ncbi:vacuolar protein sorting-associated protein 37B-like [Salvelinus namaycush]|uniref:Vacuolar protein sorting-associated protein 37B-like n=1 Tax=Salvelinus namaycush TaxID=8040 RepID=A0A8U0U6U1_SALNM|nr:vacuolar protein sorting-associated protein 37B-like [Salvelinus namaycush]
MSGFWNKFSSYSMTQLNEMLEDDDKFNTIIQEMEEMQEVQQIKEMILASNRSLAEQNLQLQPSLEHQKSQLTKCYSSLQESFEAYHVHKSKLDHTSGNSSLETLLALLQAEGAKIEEETENMADSFLDGDVTLDTFIDSYQSKRKLAHLRRVKIDKLQEMVLKGHRLPQVPVSCSHPQEVSARPAPLYTEVNNHSPVPQPRRAPPPPPAQQPPGVAPQPAVFSYPAIPYPPIPPRAAHLLPSVNPAHQHHFMSQCPPVLPQRPPPRMAPQSGFMI